MYIQLFCQDELMKTCIQCTVASTQRGRLKFYNVGDKSFETLITMGSFKESKFKLTCCAGQGLITIEVVMQKLKKVENFDC